MAAVLSRRWISTCTRPGRTRKASSAIWPPTPHLPKVESNQRKKAWFGCWERLPQQDSKEVKKIRFIFLPSQKIWWKKRFKSSLPPILASRGGHALQLPHFARKFLCIPATIVHCQWACCLLLTAQTKQTNYADILTFQYDVNKNASYSMMISAVKSAEVLE